jgi:hypothetical protein
MKKFILPPSSFLKMPLLPRNCKGYESRNRATVDLKRSIVQPFNGSRISSALNLEPWNP